MNELAWIIVALTISFLILPAIGAYLSGDDFIPYKNAWLLGNGFAVFFVLFCLVVGAIGWAFKTVFS